MIKFYFGCMGSGKTTELIKTYSIYKRKGLEPVVIKPAIDDREGDFNGWGTTQSRITKESIPCYYYKNINEIYKLNFESIFVDEAQFLNPKDIKHLVAYADNTGVPLLAYGLKTDVNGDLFEGAKTWLALADHNQELECLCEATKCPEKAVLHARFIDGVRDRSGQSVAIEKGNVTYMSLCRKHWREM